jgi:deoxyribonuclease-4
VAGDYDGVWTRFSDVIGLRRLGLIHMNDSRYPFASRRDRHEHIGEGSLGDLPFRRIMTDESLAAVPKIIETPKDDDPVAADRRNLARLRAFRTSP